MEASSVMMGMAHSPIIREFEFSQENFDFIRAFVSEHTGIVLSEAKKDMVYSRLSKRLRQTDLSSFDDFCQAIRQENKAEQEFLINAITTNQTSFFREKHHFDFLAENLIPGLLKEHEQKTKRIRIWSAGCATGEEAYSLAMTFREQVADIDDWDIRILATDLDSKVIEHAKLGIYPLDRMQQGVTEQQLKKWFKVGKKSKQGLVKVCDEVRQMVTFKRLNLLHPWPMKGPFDFIFCRNVVIYFDKTTQNSLFDRYADILKSKGYLFIGHSETVEKVNNCLQNVGRTIYQKRG